MAQQTAVEYIISQLRLLAFNKNTHLGMGDVRVTQGLINELEEQAKQIEKEQIMQSYNDGKSAVIHIEENKSLEQYYNETYNK